MKGIMFIKLLKSISGLYLCACLVTATKDKNDSATTTTTTTTAKPFDLSVVETRHFENSVPVLHPGESLTRSHSLSYSRSAQHYDPQNPGVGGEINEHSEQSKEQYNGDSGKNSYHHLGQEQQEQQAHAPQSVFYFSSQEAHPHYSENDRKNYKEPSGQKNSYPHPSHDEKEQTSYGYQESYGPTKDENYGNDRPLFHYAYEIASDPQHQQSYDLTDVPNSAEKSTYGSSESEDYAPKTQEVDYYPKPKPTRYIPEDIHKESYRSEEKKENYFPNIPKEAGYVTNLQKEPGYLQTHQKEPSYPKEAGYSPRNNEPSAFLPILRKEKSVVPTNDGKVALYIKHLGHKTPRTNQYGNKERHGFLLLPVLHQKMEEKLKEFTRKPRQEHKQEYKEDYQDNKQTSFRQSSVGKKQEDVQSKFIYYPVNTKEAAIHQVPAYNSEEEPSKLPEKTTVSHSNYHIVRPVIKYSTGENIRYKNSEEYAEKDKSDAGSAPYVPQSIADYGKQQAEKTYSAKILAYGGQHGVIPSPTGAKKQESASLYAKEPEYAHPYDVTTSHKSTPTKTKDFHPSAFSQLYHAQGYPRIVDLSLQASKSQKNTPISSHLYSTGAGESPRYQNTPSKASSDHEQSFLELLQKPHESEISGFKPSTYTSRGRVSAKGLVEGFGLHDYESLLSNSNHEKSLDSLYYDLHSFPAEHVYTGFHYPRSGIHSKLIL